MLTIAEWKLALKICTYAGTSPEGPFSDRTCPLFSLDSKPVDASGPVASPCGKRRSPFWSCGGRHPYPKTYDGHGGLLPIQILNSNRGDHALSKIHVEQPLKIRSTHLKCHREKYGKQDLERKLGFVGSVGPQAMSSSRHSQHPSQHIQWQPFKHIINSACPALLSIRA